MLRLILDSGFFLLGILIMKGVIEPAGQYWGSRLARKYLPKLFDQLDPLFPDLIKGLSKQELRSHVLHTLLRLETEEGEQLTDRERIAILEQFASAYDPFVNADKVVPS